MYIYIERESDRFDAFDLHFLPNFSRNSHSVLPAQDNSCNQPAQFPTKLHHPR